MKHIPEDIVEALRIIQETCEESDTCSECPLSTRDKDTECLIRRLEPNEWIICEPPSVWKALRP